MRFVSVGVAALLPLVLAGCMAATPSTRAFAPVTAPVSGPAPVAPTPAQLAGAARSGSCAAPAAVEADVFARTNRHRAAAGLAPLRPDPALSAAAQAHACDMARRSSMTHVGGDGSTLGTRLRRQGYAFATGAENIARGSPGPAEVVAIWMGSSGHRSNILNTRMSEAGLGLALGRDGRPYWAMVYGARR